MKQTIQYVLLTFILISQNGFAALKQAPDIDLPGADENIRLENLKGKVVYLDFWASWCQPCKNSFLWMRNMKHIYADQGLEILAVNLDKDRKLADAFLKEMDVNFKVAFDSSGESASEYKVKGMPSSYLIGRDGKVYASHIGFREKDITQIEQAIKSLLNK